jgi:hypothetical protein
MMFLDCPAYLDQDGALRCGIPAEVRLPVGNPDPRLGMPSAVHPQPFPAGATRDGQSIDQKRMYSRGYTCPRPRPSPITRQDRFRWKGR